MYQFNIAQEENGCRLELGGINLVADSFSLKDGKHWIENPKKAMAFFNIDGHLYGISNELTIYKTAEDFYEAMNKQYKIFRNGYSNTSHHA